VPYSYAQYAGNGSATTFSVPFPYLLKAHVKVYLGLVIETGAYTTLLAEGTGYTWVSDTQVQVTAAPTAGVRLTVRRETPNGSQVVAWNDGSNLIQDDLNISDLQSLYVVQEWIDFATRSNQVSQEAIAEALEAVATADAASAAADAALAGVGSALPYAPIATVAAIPASPAAGARIEIANSAGIESFSPLSGRPAGFVGSAQLKVRLSYSGSSWQWVDYIVGDPDSRYVKQSADGGGVPQVVADAITGAIDTHELDANAHLQYALAKIRHSRCIYVATNGHDLNNTGAIDSPLKTHGAAAVLALPGDVVFTSPGTYVEPVLPIRWRPDVTVFGSGMRSTVIQGATGLEFTDIFKVDSGFWCWGISFAGHQADTMRQAWAISYNELADNTARGAISLGAFILKSPYIQNCTSITAEDDAGLAGSQSTGNTGGGIKVDGNASAANSPIRSMVVDSYTQVNLGGPGCLVINDGYAQLVSFFGTFCEYHVRCESGGQVNLSGGGTSDFGIYGLMADGYSPKPLYTGGALAATYGATRLQKAVTIDTTTDTFSCAAHGLSVGSQVRFEVTNGDFPTGLTATPTSLTSYHVIDSGFTANAFRVSTTAGGAAINMTGAATGTYQFIRQGATQVDVVGFSANRLGRQIKYPSAGSIGSAGNPVTITAVSGSTAGSAFTVTLATSTIIHEYVGGGTVTAGGVSYPITSASFNNTTGVLVLTATGYAPTLASVTLSGLSFICSSASRPNAGQLMFPQLVFPRNTSTGAPQAKTFSYTRTGNNTLTYNETAFPSGPEHEYVSGGTAVIGGIDYGVANAVYNKTTGVVTLTTKTTLPTGDGSVLVGGLAFICPTSAYVVTNSVPISGGYRVEFFSDTNGGLKDPIAAGQRLDFRNRSQVSAPSHTFEFVGSGTNYDALPWNGGVPIPANEIVESNNGRVYSSNTNEKGDFKVGKQFEVNGTTGSVTISTDEFNLAGLNFIGPFSRNGGISTVGEQLREISNNPSLIASTGGVDGNTVPTLFAVKSYADNSFLQDVTVDANLPLTLANSSIQNSQGFWMRRRNISLLLNAPLGLVQLDAEGRIPSTLQSASPQFDRVGVGVAPATNFGMTMGTGFIQRNQVISISGTTYTMDVRSGNEFTAGATIATATTVTASNAGNIPAGYTWPGEFRFTYSGGTVTWFPGFTVKWDGGVAPVLTTGEQETIVARIIGGTSPQVVELAALRGRT
jgi:hypothetical protein